MPTEDQTQPGPLGTDSSTPASVPPAPPSEARGELALQALIDDATFDYTMGEAAAALAKLRAATQTAPDSFPLWHTLAEIYLGNQQLDDALAAAQRAHALRPDELLINTTLSRIHVARGDQAAAEKYGAQAKILGWKEQLREGQS